MSCSAPVLPAAVRHRDVVVDAVRRRARLVDDDAPERERDERDAVAKRRKTIATATPRRIRRRCRSRTSGLSRNAITAAIRNRKSTWPSEPGEHPDDEEHDGQADELDPPWDLDRRARTARSWARIVAADVRARSPRDASAVEGGETSATVTRMATPRIPASGPAPCPTTALSAARPPAGRARHPRRTCYRHAPPDGVRVRASPEPVAPTVPRPPSRPACRRNRDPGHRREPPDQAPDRCRRRHRNRLPRRAPER